MIDESSPNSQSDDGYQDQVRVFFPYEIRKFNKEMTKVRKGIQPHNTIVSQLNAHDSQSQSCAIKSDGLPKLRKRTQC
jgi:hypothetical protein